MNLWSVLEFKKVLNQMFKTKQTLLHRRVKGGKRRGEPVRKMAKPVCCRCLSCHVELQLHMCSRIFSNLFDFSHQVELFHLKLMIKVG